MQKQVRKYSVTSNVISRYFLRRPSFFVLPTFSIILLLLVACGDGLSGSATGRNVADMEHLEGQLSIFSENMLTFNEENLSLIHI